MLLSNKLQVAKHPYLFHSGLTDAGQVHTTSLIQGALLTVRLHARKQARKGASQRCHIFIDRQDGEVSSQALQPLETARQLLQILTATSSARLRTLLLPLPTRLIR